MIFFNILSFVHKIHGAIMDSSNTYVYNLRTEITYPSNIMTKATQSTDVPKQPNLLIKETFTLSFPNFLIGPRTIYRVLAVSSSPHKGIQLYSSRNLNLTQSYQILNQDLESMGHKMELLVDRYPAVQSVTDQILATITPCFIGCEFPLFYSGNGKNSYLTLGTKQVDTKTILFFPNQPIWHGNYTMMLNYEAYGLISLDFDRKINGCFMNTYFNPWFGNFFMKSPVTVEFNLPKNILPQDVSVDLDLEPFTTEYDPRANFYLYKAFRWASSTYTTYSIQNHFRDHCITTKSFSLITNTTKIVFDSSCFNDFKMDMKYDSRGFSALLAVKLMTGDWKIRIRFPSTPMNEVDCNFNNYETFTVKPSMPTMVADYTLIRMFSLISIVFFALLVVMTVCCVFSTGICGDTGLSFSICFSQKKFFFKHLLSFLEK